MANIDPAPSWANIRRLETTDRNMAGPGGILNDPTTSIAARLNLLRDNDTTLGNSVAAVNSRQDSTDSAIATIQGQVLTAPGTLSDLENGAALDPAAAFPDVPSVENTLGPVDAINSSIEKLTARTKQLRQWRDADKDYLAATTGASIVGMKRAGLGSIAQTIEQNLARMALTVQDFGGVADGGTDDLGALNNALSSAAVGLVKTVRIVGPVAVSATVQVPNGVVLDCADGYIVALSGFAETTAVLRFGNNSSDPAGRWQGTSPCLRVDCQGQRIIGIEFSRVWGRSDFKYCEVLRHNYKGIWVRAGFGVYLHNYEVTCPTLNAGSFNAGLDTVGVEVSTSDCYVGPGTVYGSFIGLRVSGNNNLVVGAHPFGLYRNTSGVPQSCPMGICFDISGEAVTAIGCIADSPSVVDYAQVASLTNGGYGFRFSGNALGSRASNCTVLIPNRSSDGEVAPASRIIGYQVSQSITLDDPRVQDQSPVAAIASRIAGPNITTSNIIGRRESYLYSQQQPEYNRKPWLARGLEFQVREGAGYQEASEKSASFGNCWHGMPDALRYNVYVNYGGTTRTISLPARQKGNNAEQAALTSALTTSALPADVGYAFYNTQDFKQKFWDGTQWRLGDGTITT